MLTSRAISFGERLSPLQRTISLGLLFQGLWFILVLGSPVVWVPSTLVYAFVYFTVYRGGCYLYFIGVAAALGITIDYILYRSAVFSFADGRFPIWLVVLWLVFASAIPIAFAVLKKYYWVASLIGATGGTSSYFLAVKLRDDVHFGEPVMMSLLLLVACWSVLMPLFFFILNRLEPAETL